MRPKKNTAILAAVDSTQDSSAPVITPELEMGHDHDHEDSSGV